MNDLLTALAKEIPNAVALIIVVVLFLTFIRQSDEKRLAHDKELEKQRSDNARERELERRTHEKEINNMWANMFRQIVQQVNDGQKHIAEALAEHEKASQARYEKMGITKDLLDTAKEAMKG